MPSFNYKAVGPTGGMDVGTVSARDIVAAQQQLKAQRLTPISVEPASASSAQAPRSMAQASDALEDPEAARALLSRVGKPARKLRAKKRVDREDVLRFTSEMAVLLKAGLPLDRAIRVQIDSAAEGAQKALLQELLASLKGGKALSVGLERRADVFSHFYVSMVRSGEASGNLAGVLAELASYLERSKAVRGVRCFCLDLSRDTGSGSGFVHLHYVGLRRARV